MAVDSASIFFSYSRTDAAFVLKVAKALRNDGENVWIDQLDIQLGTRWDEAVETALRECSCLVVVLTPASIISQNVMDEVAYALEARKTVLPLIKEPCAIPFRLKRIQHIDFAAIGYDAGYEELLRAVRRPRPRPPAPAEVPLPEHVVPVGPPAPPEPPTPAATGSSTQQAPPKQVAGSETVAPPEPDVSAARMPEVKQAMPDARMPPAEPVTLKPETPPEQLTPLEQTPRPEPAGPPRSDNAARPKHVPSARPEPAGPARPPRRQPAQPIGAGPPKPGPSAVRHGEPAWVPPESWGSSQRTMQANRPRTASSSAKPQRDAASKPVPREQSGESAQLATSAQSFQSSQPESILARPGPVAAPPSDKPAPRLTPGEPAPPAEPALPPEPEQEHELGARPSPADEALAPEQFELPADSLSRVEPVLGPDLSSSQAEWPGEPEAQKAEEHLQHPATSANDGQSPMPRRAALAVACVGVLTGVGFVLAPIVFPSHEASKPAQPVQQAPQAQQPQRSQQPNVGKEEPIAGNQQPPPKAGTAPLAPTARANEDKSAPPVASSGKQEKIAKTKKDKQRKDKQPNRPPAKGTTAQPSETDQLAEEEVLEGSDAGPPPSKLPDTEIVAGPPWATGAASTNAAADAKAAGADSKNATTDKAAGADSKSVTTDKAAGADSKNATTDKAAGAGSKNAATDKATGADSKNEATDKAAGADSKNEATDKAMGADSKSGATDKAGADSKNATTDKAAAPNNAPVEKQPQQPATGDDKPLRDVTVIVTPS